MKPVTSSYDPWDDPPSNSPIGCARPKVCYTYPGLEHMEDRDSASRPPRDGDEKQTMGGDGGGT
jgi:hypothetical protein